MEQDPVNLGASLSALGWLVFPMMIVPWLAVVHAAYAKGISLWAAGAVGLFGTPILGFLYVIAQPTNSRLLARRDIKAGRARRCHTCQLPIHPMATVCCHCGDDKSARERGGELAQAEDRHSRSQWKEPILSTAFAEEPPR